MPKEPAAHGPAYVPVIDSIRFLAALWVFFSHYAGQLRDYSDSIAARLLGASFDGVAAVVLFFIISGFCIHLPYADRPGFHVWRYFLRRYVRIGLPLVACLIVMHLLGGFASAGGQSVLWSVYAELVYYTLYPVIFVMQRKWGFGPVLLASSALSLGVTLAWPDTIRIWEFGTLTWVWGLPIWIAGAALAQKYRQGQLASLPGKPMFWRAGIWLLSVGALLLVFHSPVKVGYPVSMYLFALAAFFWISRELSAGASRLGKLSYLGQFTYSLYLMHNVVIGYFLDVTGPTVSALQLLAMLAAVVVVTAAFFYLVERPAHRLARWLTAARPQRAIPAGGPG